MGPASCYWGAKNGIDYDNKVGEILNVEYQDPSNYNIEINSTEQSFLIFHEAYDRDWMIEINGEKTKSFLSYYCFNTFILSHEGRYNIEISYSTQEKIVTLWVMGVVSFLLLSISFLLANRKNTLIQR